MRSLSDEDLLVLWENGLQRHPIDRALAVLAAAYPDTPYERLADWPLGRRNLALVEMRTGCFGPGLAGWTACAQCAEKLEFELDGRVITAQAAPNDGDAHDQNALSDKVIAIKRGRFRIPTSRDLARAASERDPRAAAIRIVESCRLSPADGAPQSQSPAGDDTTSNAAAELPIETWADGELDEIGELMAQADPLAETRLELDCPKCGNHWDETLDIVGFVWSEIEARARRLLTEIHTLASAYGWTEREILSLGRNRRARYVEMVQG